MWSVTAVVPLCVQREREGGLVSYWTRGGCKVSCDYPRGHDFSIPSSICIRAVARMS